MKKLFSIIVAIILAVSLLPISSTAAAKFKDVPATHEFYKEISYLVDNKYVNGYPDGTFKPQANLTRAHATIIIANVFGLDLQNVSNPGFTDVPTSYPYYKQIETVAKAGIMQGVGNKKFEPNAPVTRAQMAEIIAKAYKLSGISDKQFRDVNSANWAYKSIQALAKNGVTLGYPDGTFKPNEKISRAHFAAFLYRAIGTTGSKPEVQPKPADTKPVVDVNSGTYVIPGAPTGFANCTDMREYYPNGVKSSHPAYASKHDRDKDGWACER